MSVRWVGDFNIGEEGAGRNSALWLRARLGDSLRMMNYCERSGSRKSTLSRSQTFPFVPCFEQSRATAVPRDSSRQLQAATGPARQVRERDRSRQAPLRQVRERDRSERDRSANATAGHLRQVANYE